MNKVLKLLNNAENIYLDCYNNFLNIKAFADHYQIPEPIAEKLIDLGRDAINFEEEKL